MQDAGGWEDPAPQGGQGAAVAQAGGQDWDWAASGGGFCTKTSVGCAGCNNLSFRQDYWQAFKVMVCASCSRTQAYDLITKATAKASYLLTEGDLKKLGHVSRPNPQHKQWAGMKLYLASQVMEAAARKHGSVEAIHEAKQERMQARLASRLDRSKHPASDEEDDSGSGAPPLSAAQRRVRQRLEAEYGSNTGDAVQGADTELGGKGAAEGSSCVEASCTRGERFKPSGLGPGAAESEVEEI